MGIFRNKNDLDVVIPEKEKEKLKIPTKKTKPTLRSSLNTVGKLGLKTDNEAMSPDTEHHESKVGFASDKSSSELNQKRTNMPIIREVDC